MRSINVVIGKIIYSLLFLLVIPAMLWYWAKLTADVISFPVVHSPIGGWSIFILGLALMLWGMISLWIHGNGLPMNAYPPKKYVVKGSFKLVKHPIYVGFGLILIGYFTIIGSASGLWLVTPISILAMIALVLGYEKIDLKERFTQTDHSTWVSLPDNKSDFVTVADRISSMCWIAATLILSNGIILIFANKMELLGNSFLNFESSFENGYSNYLSFVFVLVIPFLFMQKKNLRNWLIMCFIGLAIIVFLATLFPSIGRYYVLNHLSMLIHVPLILILISVQQLYSESKVVAIIMGVLGLILLAFGLMISVNIALYLIISLLICVVTVSYKVSWKFLRKISEKIANSWKEWKFGKIRVINHGFYTGFGSFLGILLAGFLAGKEYAWGILTFAIIVVVFSAIWAQLIEGSEKLKRPYGYYGALVGIIFASLAMWAMGLKVWVVIGVISVVMPWVQAIGRLRCLVNGCCHGKPLKNEVVGIRYHHHRSRVTHLSQLKGELLHPTPLYSMLWLFLVGIVLLALWNRGYPSNFIFGLYLILTGIGRFVEEAYRGEIQTAVIKGLRLYQWTAILSVIVGIGMTMLNVVLDNVTSGLSWEILLAAFLGGLFTTFAMGVDFPYSNARFSRLV